MTRGNRNRSTSVTEVTHSGDSNPNETPVELTPTGDALWDRLMLLPYFKNTTLEKQQEIYEKEREREREEREKDRKERERNREIELERERREHELRMRQIDRDMPVRAPAADTPTPRAPRVCLPEWSDSTRPDVYFNTIEKLFQASGLEERFWVNEIIHKLPERAHKIYAGLAGDDANNYEVLKKAVLDEYKVSPVVNRKNFFQWSKRPTQTYKQFMKSLRDELTAWVGTSNFAEVDWPEVLLKYRLDQQLNDEISLFLLDKNVTSCDEAADLADAYILNRKIVSKVGNGHSNGTKARYADKPPTSRSGLSHNVNTRTVPPDSTQRAPPLSSSVAPTKYCTYCQRRGHWRADCFIDPSSSKYRGRRANETRMYGSTNGGSTNGGSAGPQTTAFASELRDNVVSSDIINPLFTKYTGNALVKSHHPSLRFPVTYLRDTGSAVSILVSSAIPPHQLEYTGESTTIRGINMSVSTYPVAKLHVTCDIYTGPLDVLVAPHRAVSGIDLLLGNNISPQGEEMSVYCGVVTRSKSKKTAEVIDTSTLYENAEQNITPSDDVTNESSVNLTDDSENRKTEQSCSEFTLPAEISAEQFLCEQKNDATLIPLWEMADACIPEDSGYYIKREPEVLMRHDRPEGRDRGKAWKTREQIVVPVKFREGVLKLSHEHPTAAHQGFKKTLARLTQKFFWPGVRRDVKLHCRACGPCQRLGRGEKSQVAPLKTLPVINRPFEFISADFVGPLKRTPTGNRYILNVIDHATKYIESYPIPCANTEYTVKAFTDLFSRHGVPNKLLTDRGSTFTGEGFESFLNDMGVQHLCSSPYRPQTNGAVERANGVLKDMLKLVMAEDRQPWDQLLPWILFAYRSAVHSTTGFSPFYLMYGREPPGPLDSVYNRWTEAKAEDALPVNQYVQELCLRTHSALEEAYQNSEIKATERKSYYDAKRKVKAVSYNPGQSVLVHLPLIGKEMRGAWQGPYLVQNKVGSHTYIIHMPDKRIKHRTFHVNAIKPWTPRVANVMLAVQPEVLSPTVDEQVRALSNPTPLELASDPCDYIATECEPTGSWPDISQHSAEAQEQLTRLFTKYSCLFDGKIGCCKGVEHDIDVENHTPIKQHFYRTSPDKLAIMRSEIDAMLRMGVIKPSKSEWASPMILVKKPNNEWRPCVDYRKVNAVSRGDSYPLPRLEDLIDKVGKASHVTTLDVAKGYWQIPLTERAKNIAAFTTPFGHFEPETMPFGLKAASSTFQRVMNNALAGLESFSGAFQDDIAIQSMSWDAHLEHLERVFMRLADLGITLNAKKCKVALPSVTYLGHQAGSGEIRPIRAKVESILNITPPATKKQLRSFLGVIGFYRRFIPRYAEISAPLTDLLKGGVVGRLEAAWHPACDAAFVELKNCLARHPVLKAPDFDMPFEMYCDASEHGIAAVLTQKEDDTHKPISYYSRKLLPREKNYSIVEKELLSIVAGLHAFRAYVGHGPLLVHSDHYPLAWLRNSRTSNQRILRWALFLSEYELTIQHIKGTDNIMADLLSRKTV